MTDFIEKGLHYPLGIAIGLGLLQLLFEIGHVAVGVAIGLGLAQAHAVDDRGVVE